MKLTKELGLMLYWGEGDKTKDYFVALTNVDPKVMVYFVNWLRRFFDINESKLKGRLYIWRDTNEKEAKEFWSKKLNIPINQFTKSYISNSVPNVRKRRHNYGVCRVSYGSKKIFSEIMEGIKKNFH